VIRIWAVMRRDLLRTSRNPFAIFSAVFLPLVYLFILGNSLEGPLTGLVLGVVNQDSGEEARELVGALQAVQNGPHTVVLETVSDPVDGHRMLRDGEINGLLVIPAGFSRDLSRGRTAAAGLFVDNVDAIAAAAIEGAVQSVLPSLRQPLARFEVEAGGAEIRPQELYPRVDYDASLIPGVVVMSIFMGSMITGAFNLVFDRFLGVHESYLSTPLRRSDINLGVLGAGTVVTLVSSGIVMIVGMIATGTRVHGGILGYLALAGVVVISALGLLAMMMVVLGRVNHPRVTGVLSGFLNVILFFPSGALYPLQSFPGWLRAFARFDPETHAVAALKAILFRGGDLAAAGWHVLWLSIFAAAMLFLSTLTLKRTL
jgi:ABC-2 type transport system permease protein